MTFRWRRVRVGALAVSLVLTAALVTAGPAGATGTRARAHDPRDLAWGSCPATAAGHLDPRQECATLRVPLGYPDPAGARISLAISRIRTASSGARRGVLLLIPGGPGNPGVDLPSARVPRLSQAVLDRYDLVGFDPRGVGRSTAVSCGLSTQDTDLLPWPSPGGDIVGNVAQARRVADACVRNGGAVLRGLSTITEARDIDQIRQALGEDRLSYWGVSYGTYVGAVYATLFGQRTDRVLLDSSDDPDPARVERGWLANYAVGVVDRFPDFAAWASAAGNPARLASTPGAVRTTFLDLAARLDRQPLAWPDGQPPALTGNALRELLLRSLYSDQSFPYLAQVMAASLRFAPLPPRQSMPADVVQNVDAVLVGTLCGDVTWPTSLADYARDVADNAARFPLTAGMPVGIGPCSFWPYQPARPPVRISQDGPSNVLLVQNLRDPATPFSGALRLRGALGDRARMVTVDSGGHGSYLANGNACGDRMVTAFLVSGERPARDAFCGRLIGGR
jgi:pimeloyl-ACP methyl ester carboxylesterase